MRALWLIVIAATGTALLWYLGSGTFRDPTDPIKNLRKEQRQPVIDADTRMAKLSSPESKGGESRGKRPKFIRSEFDAFLSERPDDPGGACAVFDLTGDRSMLMESLQKYPNSPELLGRIVLTEDDPQAKLGYAERLIKASPDNSLGFYEKAVALFRLGKIDLAQSALDGGLGLSPPAVDDQRALLLRRQALESAGRSSDDARILSILYPGDPTGALLGDLKTFAQSVNEGTVDGLSIGAERAVAMAEHLLHVPSPLINNRWAVLGVQAALLEKIDPDLLFGDTGRTVSEQLQAVSAEEAEISELVKQAPVVESALSTHDFAIYMDDVMALGWRKAFESLREKVQQK